MMIQSEPLGTYDVPVCSTLDHLGVDRQTHGQTFLYYSVILLYFGKALWGHRDLTGFSLPPLVMSFQIPSQDSQL